MNNYVLEYVRITKEEVLAVLKCMKVDKSPGPDQMYSWTLWEAKRLLEIWQSFASSTSEVLKDWRLVNVVPKCMRQNMQYGEFKFD